MLDYLKKVSNILIILILLTTACQASKESKKEEHPPIFNDSHLKFIFNKVGDYVANNEWDFETTTFKPELLEIDEILRKNGIKYEDQFISIVKYRADLDIYWFYVIRVGVYLRGIENDWVGQWTLIEGENIIEDIRKIEKDDEGIEIPKKQNI